jgi:HD-GYP domain-containing protein (c-di-GMP phosphodiesterase class II)
MRIYYAALLHDIGKAGERHRILLRNQPLNEADKELIKEHALTGSRLLEDSQSELLREGGLAVLSKYEWFDGTGYPRGLKGENIPYVARIISLADAFDSLCISGKAGDNPDFDSALEKLKERSGAQFDPFLVEVFLRNAEEARGLHVLSATR